MANIFRLIGKGFYIMVASVFGMQISQRPGIERLRKEIESYSFINDKKRLHRDYTAIGGDWWRAYNKLSMQNSEQ